MGFFDGYLGGLHTLTAASAMLLGGAVLVGKHGTPRHKKLGYAYVACMSCLNLTAIPIQRLYGGFGPFHFFILLSLLTVVAGIYYPVLGRAKTNWVAKHSAFMYWSYVGLMAAFVNEVIIRLPLVLLNHSNASTVVGGDVSAYAIITALVASAIVMAVGEYVHRKYMRKLGAR